MRWVCATHRWEVLVETVRTSTGHADNRLYVYSRARVYACAYTRLSPDLKRERVRLPSSRLATVILLRSGIALIFA